jgi:hypothetical protein
VSLRRSIVGAILAIALPFAASAQQTNLPGGYASLTDFVVGTWKWERQEPRWTVVARFERSGAFRVHYRPDEIIILGSYGLAGGRFYLRLTQRCDHGQCRTIDPPREVDYPVNVVNAGKFTSADEVWERQ